MPSLNIITSAYGDQRAELAGAQLLRKIDIGTDWNKIRFAFQYSFNGGNTIGSTTPKLAIGLASGDTYGFLVDELSLDKFIGWTTYSAWTYTAGPPSYYSTTLNAMRVAAGVRTDSFGSSSSFLPVNYPSTRRAVLVVDVTKGSPNWTFDLGLATNSTGATTDIDDDTVIKILELSEINAVINLLISGYGTNHYTLAATTVDDAGTPMDTIHISWSRSDVTMEISKVFWRKIS